MIKRIVGAVSVLTVTFVVLGMGTPQENTNDIIQTDLINTTESTEALLNQAEITQDGIEETKEQEIALVVDNAGGEAIIHDSATPIVETVVDQNKRKTKLSSDEILLLERIVSAESRGECFEAQYDVACVVLNRMESETFPNTLNGVVMQPGQFSCVPTGAYLVAPITESVKEAVAAAIDNNTLDNAVLWFRSGYYHSYRINYKQVGRLFFSI